MANQKISQLSSGAPAQTTDELVVARSGSNFRLFVSDVIALFAGAINFSALTSGVNTTAAMTVGTGASLEPSGSGIVEANQLNNVVVSGTPSAGQNLTATSPTAADWQTPSEAVAASSITLLGSPVSISGLTTVLTKTVTMPSSGGPFRAFVSYGYYANAGTHGLIQAVVNDGTNNMATTQLNIYNDGNTDGREGSSFSPVTYANGASVTFTLKVNNSTASTVTVEVNNDGSIGQATWLNIAILPSA